jgi:hypothetical protein
MKPATLIKQLMRLFNKARTHALLVAVVDLRTGAITIEYSGPDALALRMAEEVLRTTQANQTPAAPAAPAAPSTPPSDDNS